MDGRGFVDAVRVPANLAVLVPCRASAQAALRTRAGEARFARQPPSEGGGQELLARWLLTTAGEVAGAEVDRLAEAFAELEGACRALGYELAPHRFFGPLPRFRNRASNELRRLGEVLRDVAQGERSAAAAQELLLGFDRACERFLQAAAEFLDAAGLAPARAHGRRPRHDNGEDGDDDDEPDGHGDDQPHGKRRRRDN